jgi:hypothetical protein
MANSRYYQDSLKKEYEFKQAVEACDLELARRLLESDTYLANSCMYEKPDGKGSFMEVMYYAVRTGNLAMVQLLVEFGAGVRANYHGTSMQTGSDAGMYEAVAMRHVEIADFLLSSGAKINGTFKTLLRGKLTFLAEAARCGDQALLAAFMCHGAEHHIWKAIYELQDEYYMLIKHYQEDPKYAAELEECQTEYETIIRNLMDYAVGQNFYAGQQDALIYIWNHDSPNRLGIAFLKDMRTIAGVNLAGVSVDGKPVTRQMLYDLKLPGADDAIITRNDILALLIKYVAML